LVDVTVTIGSQTGTLADSFTYYSSQIFSVTPNHGSFGGGTEVVIKGANFVTGSTVAFDGVAATAVSFVDDETYFATTPSHAQGAVDVTVTEPTGFVARLTKGFKYTLFTRGADIRRQPGIVIRDVLNNQANKCSFTVDGASNTPIVGEQIEILDEQDGNRLMFSGNIQSVTQEYEEQTNQLVWRIDAIDFTFLLNKYRPIGIYTNMSVTGIVKDMIARFAPGFTTTDYVQTNLAKVTATFDGSQDFSTCLNQLAQAIGAGHWYVDYLQRVHFFHTQLESVILPGFDPRDPNAPNGVIRLGPGNAMVVTEGALIPSTHSFNIGFYMFWSTFYYDNGVESALSPLSNVVALQGNKQIDFSNLAIGPTVGTHLVTKRRIYSVYIGPLGITPMAKFCQINDNTTTSFTSQFFADQSVGSTPAGVVVSIPATATLPVRHYIPPPAFTSEVRPSAAQGTAEIFRPQYPPLYGEHIAATYTPAPWGFKITNLYRNGTESQASNPTNTTALNGTRSSRLEGVPLGVTINSVDVIARKVYGCMGSAFTRTLSEVVSLLQALQNAGNLGSEVGYGDAERFGNGTIPSTYQALVDAFGQSDIDRLLSGGFADPDWSPDRTKMWYLIPDNTTTVADIGPGTGEGSPPVVGGGPEVPQWPNPNGPYLENFDPPDEINDTNGYLLREPKFTQSIDLSQIRNRVKVKGAGSATVAAAVATARVLEVSDLSVYSGIGGLVYVRGMVLAYVGLSAASGIGTITLRDGLPSAVPAGEPVHIFFEANDIRSQEILSAIELDKDGNPTDGVHEYMVVDTTIVNPFQMFMRAYAELELFANPVITIHYATRDPKTRSGATQVVDLSDPQCKGEFLIQDVTIDQIHDESDSLTPRYTVTASSVKFDLSDLLLQLIGSTVGANVSLTGFVNTLPTTTTPRPAISRANGYHFPSGANSAAAVGDSASAIGTAGTFDTAEIPPLGATSALADESWQTRTTTGSNGNTSGIALGVTFQIENNFDIVWQIKTGKVITDILYWFGMQTAGGALDTDPTGTNRCLCMFRYSTEQGDLGWTGVLRNTGVSAPFFTIPITTTIKADTYYTLRMYSTRGTSLSETSVSWSVNEADPITATYEDTLDSSPVGYAMPVSNNLASLFGLVQKASGSGNPVKKVSWRWCQWSKN